MSGTPSRAARHCTRRPSVVLGILAAGVLAAACSKQPPAVTAPVAAPPVAAKPMPPIPDLSRRTFRRPIPGVPTQSTGLTQPALRQLGDLKYPARAWDQGLQGWAVFDFVVGRDGRVDARYVRLVATSDSIFVRPAGDAVRTARFTPGSRAGTPVPMLVRLPVTFTIETAPSRGSPAGR